MAVGVIFKAICRLLDAIAAEEGQDDLIEHLQGIEWEDDDMIDPIHQTRRFPYC